MSQKYIEHGIPDISSWEKMPYISILGSRDKIFLREPDSATSYFIKFPLKTLPIEQEQEVITEYIATKLAESWGLETHSCYPAVYGKKLGLNNRRLIQQNEDKIRLVYPKQLIQEDLSRIGKDLPSEKDRKAELQLHTFDKILELYSKQYDAFFERGFISGFLSMILFDAIVGMCDRHWENYAILRTNFIPSKEDWDGNTLDLSPLVKLEVSPPFLRMHGHIWAAKFAPLYDNASCLFWNIRDAEICNTELEMEKYAQNKQAISSINVPGRKKVTLFELLGYIVSGKAYPESDISIKDSMIKAFTNLKEQYNNTSTEEVIHQHHFGLFSEHRIEKMGQYIKVRMNLVENIISKASR